MMARIIDLKTVYQGWCRMWMATVEDDGHVIRREIEDHGPAVAVLPYDPDRRTALLIRQPRAPYLHAGDPRDLLEPPAGIVDPGEDSEAAGRRECEEEVGVRLTRMDLVGHVFTMPGISTERMSLYLAPYSPADRIGPGGGKASENERLEVIEAGIADLWGRIETGQSPDGKLLILLQALKLRRPELF